MGILDDVTSAVNGFFDTFDDLIEASTNPELDGTQASEVLAETIENVEPVSEIGGAIVDLTEEFILADVQEAGQLTPDNIEAVVDQAEGGAAAVYGGVLTASSAFEAASLGQLDSHEELVAEAVAAFSFVDLVGRELEARMQEGIDPALKQMVHRDHRSKQADFKDFTEANLRSKSFGGGIETRSGDIPDQMQDLFHADDFGWLADPDTYGTIPDQTSLFELDALAHLEPEELFEEGPQKGVVPSRAATEQILKISGLPEDVQSVFLTLWENIPRSADMVEESIAFEEPMRVIDEAVFENRMSVDHAVNLARPAIARYVQVSDAGGTPETEPRTQEDVVNIIMGELRVRWSLLQSVPNDVPSRGQIERWFRNGVLSSQQFFNANEKFGIRPQDFGPMFVDNCVRQGAEDIAQQFILGRISASDARMRLGVIGYTDDEVAQLLAGADPDDVIQERFVGQAEAAQLPVSLAVEIGTARSAVLNQVGIDSLSELAQVSVDDLTTVTGMSDTEAQQAIDSAQRILQQGG